MEPSLILDALYTYRKEEFESIFLEETINYFSNRKEKIVEIENNYELAGVRLTLFYNLDRYCFNITTRKRKDFICYRKIKLNDTEAEKMYLQLNAILNETNNLCPKKISELPPKTLYFGVIDGKETNKNFYEIDSLFLSRQSLYFLEHQNISHYCQLVKEEKSTIVLNEFNLLQNMIRDFDWRVKDRLFVYSGGVFQFLGAIYSGDIDLIYVSPDGKYNEIDGFEEYFDVHIITPKRVIELKDEKNGKKTLPYKDSLYRYSLSLYVGQKSIYEMLINPENYFHFIGVKCLDIFSNIYRNMGRSNSFTMIDLIMLKEYAQIDMIDKFCVKNIVIRRGVAKINTDQKLKEMYKNASKWMKIWYEKDLSPEYFQKRFKRCENIYFRSGDSPSIETINIFKFNRYVLRTILYKYNNGKLLDIGIGKCASLFDYMWKNYSLIVGIEPSLESIEICHGNLEFLSKGEKSIPPVFIYPGKGEDNWEKGVLEHKYDLVVMNFTIHYTLDYIDKLVDNINSVTKKGAVIVINYLDGDKIKKKMGQGDYIIKHDGDIQWGSFKFQTVSGLETMIYMKDAYGVSNGSIEKLASTKKIISAFSPRFSVIGNSSYLDFMKNAKKWKNLIKFKFQKEIISLHRNLILIKN